MKYLSLSSTWIIFFSIIQLVISCAEPSMPQGGPKDTRPPTINKKKYSTPNEMTNFDYKEVILTFDEWVKLQNAYSQVIISPPLKERPTIKVRNKSVVVSWKENLKDSTTYLIQYGEAIQDLTESNVAPNLVRVFSTGDAIDSLQTEGQVLDAVTRTPQKDVLVMLYQNLADSVPKTEKPYYFARTDDRGRFQINYIKKGRYKIFALQEKNNDYKFNQVSESIAFLDSTFIINDTTQPIIRLRLFTEKQPTTVLEEDLFSTTQLRIKFNNPLEGNTTLERIGAPAINYTIWQDADSAVVWFETPLDSSQKYQFLIRNDKEPLKDTIDIKKSTIAQWIKEPTAIYWEKGKMPSNTRGNKPKKTTNSVEVKALNPNNPIASMIFNSTLQTIDSSLIELLRDTTINITDSLGNTTKIDTLLPISLPFQIIADSLRPNLFYLSTTWDTLRRYQLRILPNALQNTSGISNEDSLAIAYKFNSYDAYGDLEATITDLQNKNYIIQLVNEKQQVLQQQLVNNVDSTTIVYEDLKVDNYTLRVINDENKTGTWDTGNYDDKKQPESIINSKSIVLKKGWLFTFRMSLLADDLSSSNKKRTTK